MTTEPISRQPDLRGRNEAEYGDEKVANRDFRVWHCATELALERRTGGGRRREKDGDKANKDQAKWDELLGLEEDTKTAEEV